MLLRRSRRVRRGSCEEHPKRVKNYEGYFNRRNNRHYRVVVSEWREDNFIVGTLRERLGPALYFENGLLSKEPVSPHSYPLLAA